MIPISFVSDHSETLYEIDILYKGLAHQLGITGFYRVPSLNDSPAFLKALSDIVVGACESRKGP
jgi:ferrochelatase